MEDKMTIIGGNKPPKEFVKYLHTLVEGVTLKNENLEKYSKYLKKYCDDSGIDANFIENEIIDLKEVMSNDDMGSDTMLKKMFYKTAKNLYFTSNQTDTLLTESQAKNKRIQNEIKQKQEEKLKHEKEDEKQKKEVENLKRKEEEKEFENNKFAKQSQTLGILSIIFVWIPILSLAVIPMSIISINKAKKGKLSADLIFHKKAKIGKVLSIISLVIIGLSLLILL